MSIDKVNITNNVPVKYCRELYNTNSINFSSKKPDSFESKAKKKKINPWFIAIAGIFIGFISYKALVEKASISEIFGEIFESICLRGLH